MRSSCPGGNCKSSRSPAPQRGSALITSVGIVVVLTILGASFMRRTMSESGISRRSTAQQDAFFLADAAVDRAALNLRTPTETLDDTTAGTLPTGSYTVDTPALVGTLQYQVTTHGTSRGESRHIEALFQLTPQSVFQFALFGDGSVDVSGNAQTDSYDSSDGPYNDDPNSPDYNKGQNGDIGTNSADDGGVTVGGSIFIEGQVAVGPSVGDPTSVVTGYDPAFITGDPKVVSQPSAFPLPDVVIPPGCQTTLPPSVKKTRTFSSSVGSYCPAGDVVINGGDKWTATGPVKIYLAGDLTINGNATIGVVNDPTKMLFLLTATGSASLQQEITGSTTFYGGIYGPNASIDIAGNAEIFGSVIAGTVDLGGSAQIHYDEALQTITDLSNTYEPSLLSWREVPQ